MTDSSSFRRDIQGLRAVAVIAVILYHAGDLLPGGFMGVDVFFVISGFVITKSLMREKERTGGISLVNFYRRRVYRLIPMLTVALGAVVFAGLLLAPIVAIVYMGRTALSAAFLAANLYLARGPGYFDSGAEFNPLLHTWSLSLEEQFYLIFPALLAGLWYLLDRRGTSSSLVAFGLIVATVASLLFGILLSFGPSLPTVTLEMTRRLSFFAMPARAWQFGAGAILASHEAGRSQTDRSGTGLGWLGALGLLGCFLFISDDLPYPGLLAPLPTAFTCLIIWDTKSGLSRALQGSRMVRMGDVSYSWYLWHWPAQVFLSAAGQSSNLALALGGLATLPLAAFSYRHVEQRYKPPKAGGSWVLITFTSLIVGIGLWGSTEFASRLIKQSLPAAAVLRPHLATACEGLLPPELMSCRFVAGSEEIVLIGDSNAGHFSESLLGVARERSASLTILTLSSCPTLDLEVFDRGIRNKRCRVQSEAVRQWLRVNPPDLVVFAAASDIYLGQVGWTVTKGELSGVDAYRAALSELVDDITQAGSEVILAHQIPKFQLDRGGRSGARECSVVILLVKPELCEPTLLRAEAEARRLPGFQVESAVAEAANVSTLDPFDFLCDDSSCSVFRDGVWLYRDSRHISVAAAEQMTPAFTDVVAAQLDY